MVDKLMLGMHMNPWAITATFASLSFSEYILHIPVWHIITDEFEIGIRCFSYYNVKTPSWGIIVFKNVLFNE